MMEKVILEFFKFGFENIRNRKIRSWLTMLGIFIGIAAIVALLSLGQGLKSAIDEQFENMGRDKIMVTPGQGLGLDASAGQIILTEDDRDLINGINGVDITSGFLYKAIPIKYKKEQKTVFVMGVYTTGEEIEVVKSMQSWEVLDGRELSKTDRSKALIGCLYAEDEKIFEKAISLKENIEISGEDFRTVGFMSCMGNNQDDSNVYIPMDVAREVFNEPDKLDMLFVKVKSGYSPQLVADKIITKMRRDRNLKEGEENFSVQTSEQLIEVFGSILAIIQFVLVGIAGISLLVGGVGIMNTMYTSVLERTREIGIMKAIGARRRYILTLFLIESGMMGAVGGAIGVVLGLLIAYGVELGAKASGFSYLNVQISPGLVLFGIGFAFIVGSAAGILPAIKAVKMQAVDALHYE
ncbi:ABC transporter permease [Candidatus Woesearchaeota archaeon]|jgi:putative ABC transport system permease protein|nr:ABC transporter permease [Candidatus Woesearchaeota archaeon]MBT5271786.1 ABC transporter permease [Candidatus Woesearchaeota archaeon]MBT6041173.1 ABC transporter permease [Candidatus Woesearchaeota archaeon]MBT6336294.1 ABC transporter permease [Candidatus Woesearchaeota archaeon]MBT7927320.1 ABC transporter permease [Candidatus Woesearchaeota archaeon]